MTIETTQTQKPWSELTKDEQKERMRIGREKAKAEREAAEAARPKKVAKEAPSRQMDEQEVRAKRARLLQELADLPSEAAVDPNSIPGTTTKDGLGLDKVPWTPARLRQACDRGETIGDHTFSWKTIIGDGGILSSSWNGIVYWLWPGRENKIPSVHHAVYMQALADRQREQSRWRGPNAPGTSDLDGFNSAEAHSADIGSATNLGHIMGVGPLEPR